ncbi:hypothetical protein BDY17DRAFT_355250 [Neohortaea acidophila]|uniref:Uncharacterized protein n=1 Tax=Neohortaea acidophila TaxID=245834 RepID=A0A6A6PQQ2_9PEZI|nr:uncharacterized protein BDY17DRAFT_355250 [Neohortaea acidophila]KAF2481567.1 hypothetical protein BDY17DRAFT_355250 [Neohortaea acidophila]
MQATGTTEMPIRARDGIAENAQTPTGHFARVEVESVGEDEKRASISSADHRTNEHEKPEDVRESIRSEAEFLKMIKDRTAQINSAWHIKRDEELMEFRIRAAREEELESKNGKLEKELSQVRQQLAEAKREIAGLKMHVTALLAKPKRSQSF